MKKILAYSLFASLLIFMGCSNNSEEDTTIDCDASDLNLQVGDVINPDCDTEGSFTLVASGGTSPYTYSLDGGDFQSSGAFSDLAAKTYTVAVTDADGCTFQGSFNLTAGPNGIALSIDKTNSECSSNTGSITVTATGGDGSFTYSIDGGADQATNTFESVGTGDHDIVVIDGTGCTATTSVKITTNISLSGDIMPILQANCLGTSSGGGGCHNGDNGADRDWTEKDNVIAKAENIKTRTQNGSMPQAGSGQTLTSEEIDIIACWVDDGALDN